MSQPARVPLKPGAARFMKTVNQSGTHRLDSSFFLKKKKAKSENFVLIGEWPGRLTPVTVRSLCSHLTQRELLHPARRVPLKVDVAWNDMYCFIRIQPEVAVVHLFDTIAQDELTFRSTESLQDMSNIYSHLLNWRVEDQI